MMMAFPPFQPAANPTGVCPLSTFSHIIVAEIGGSAVA